MLRAVATAGYLGCLPAIGPALATAAGLCAAAAVFLASGRLEVVMLAWTLVLVAAAWALPRALAAGLADRQIVIDRFAGIWLAAAPALPLAGLLTTEHRALAMTGLVTPLVLYLLLLAAPLRGLGRSGRVLYRIGDDLLAGLLAAIGTMAVLVLLLARAGGAP